MKSNKSKTFYRCGSWYHRTKFLRDDFTVGYGKKGGYATAEEAEKGKIIMDKLFEEQKNNAFGKRTVLLSEFLEDWFYNVQCNKISSACKMNMEHTLKQWIMPFVSDIELNQCNTEYIDQLLEKASTLTTTSAEKAREVLSIAFNYAYQSNLIDKNPVKQAKRYSHNKKPLKVLSDDEIKRFLLCASANSRFLEILLALFCGLSRAEIYGLKFSDFDADARTLTVSREIVQDKKFDAEKQKEIYCSKVQELRTQNNYRTLAVPDIIFDELSKREVMIEANKIRYQPYYDEDYICCQKDGKTPALSLLNDALSAICKKSKLGSITVQDLRNTYAVRFLNDFGTLQELSLNLGYSSIKTTDERYGNFSRNPQSAKEIIDSIFKVS